MGIIEKQATRNLIYSYLGAALGFVTVLWSSHLFNPDQNGLTRILVSYSALFSQFAGLGFNASTVRFFPYFRNKEKGHHGFLYYGIVTTISGFMLCAILFIIFKDRFVAANIDKSKLFVDYIWYLLPLTLFTLFFNLFDYYLRACYSSVIGASSKEFIQRLSILIAFLLYFFRVIDFPFFILLYIVATCLPTLILLYYIVRLEEWHVKPVKGFLSRSLRNEMISLSLFSIIAGGTGLMIANVDIIIVNQKLGLTQTGIYSIAFYFGTIIIIPARSLQRIATSIVADAFRNNDMAEIRNLYNKSCNNQLAIGTLLFAGIWCNIENIMHLLPADYSSGRNVILFISAGYLVDMGTGINYLILNTSKYYRYDTYFMFFVLAITVALNYLLIPKFGITGSAIATAITISLYNLMRYIFIYLKFGMQPFDRNTVKILTIAIIAFLPGFYLPYLGNFFVDTAVRSTIVGVIFILLMLRTNAAPDLNAKIRGFARFH